MKEAQELHCHQCGKYVRFTIDMGLDGNHVLDCPNCGHEHCRVVKDGVITDDRWDRRNGMQTYYISSTTTIMTAYSGSGYFLTGAWAGLALSTEGWTSAA